MPDENLSKEELLRLLREQMALAETLKGTVAERALAGAGRAEENVGLCHTVYCS